MSSVELPFWERPEVVARFAAREPDHRLIELLETRNPEALKVLDIGCAAGRNAVYLAEKGADLFAIDASHAMLAKTQSRVAELMGQGEAQRRIQLGHMNDLSRFKDESFDLVLALGVYQDAPSQAVWEQTLIESARVLKKEGLCLVANFGPDSKPQAKPLQRLKGTKHQYLGFAQDGRVMTLLNKQALDLSFANRSLYPFKETYTVKTEFELGFRTTVNALYQKA